MDSEPATAPDLAILNSLAGGSLTPAQAVDQLVALGADRGDAGEMVAIQTGKSQGDVIEVPDDCEPKRQSP